MVRYLILILLASKILYAEVCEEMIRFRFDTRQWKIASESSTDQSSLVEYTVAGETKENWTELVTLERFSHFQLTVDQYFNQFKDGTTRILRKDKGTILFEWWNETEHGWIRMIKSAHSAMVLRYTTKRLDDLDETRSIWEPILNNAKFYSSGQCS